MPRTGIEECHLRQSCPTQGLCHQLSWVTIRHFSTCGQCLPCGPRNTRTETVTAGIASAPAAQRRVGLGMGCIRGLECTAKTTCAPASSTACHISRHHVSSCPSPSQALYLHRIPFQRRDHPTLHCSAHLHPILPPAKSEGRNGSQH